VRPPLGTPATYRLDDSAPLRTHFARSGPFDSRLEADFAREFAEKFGGQRGPWLLSREDDVLLLGDTVMIPDFALTHKRLGQRVLLRSSDSGIPTTCAARWRRCALPTATTCCCWCRKGWISR